jgi:hypothetical protein
MKKIKAVDENILFLFLVIILSGTILTNPCTTFAWCLKKSCVVGEDRSGGSSSGSSREYYNYTTPPTYDPQAQNRQQAFNINQQGVMYYNNKDCANALQSFKQALQYWPDNATIQKNLQNAQSCLGKRNSAKGGAIR